MQPTNQTRKQSKTNKKINKKKSLCFQMECFGRDAVSNRSFREELLRCNISVAHERERERRRTTAATKKKKKKAQGNEEGFCFWA
jgi:hypothetical protein